MKVKDVVEYHSKVSTAFDNNYNLKSNFSERLLLWKKIIKRYSNSESTALDAGCGSGVLTKFLSQYNRSSVGIDPSKEMLDLANLKKNKYNLKNTEFIKSNIEDYVHSTNKKFNIVISSSVLEYVDDLKKNFLMLRDLLDEDGVIIFSLPNRISFYRNLELLSFRLIGYPRYFSLVKNLVTLETTLSILTELNFKIITEKFYGQLKFERIINKYFVRKKYFYHNYIVIARKTKSKSEV